MSTEKEKTA